MNTKKFTTIIIILVVLIIAGFSGYYLITKKQPAIFGTKKTTSVMPTNAQILRRLTAPLNTQSSSINIKDIKRDLNATDLTIIDEGIKK